MLTKNPLTSTIFCEYWNSKESRYAKAYIDFIIKVKDKNKFVFVEVKSIDDYDEEKTKSIKTELENYRSFINNPNVELSIAIVAVDKDQTDDIKMFDVNQKGIFVSFNSVTNTINKFLSITNVLDYLKK